MLTKFLIGNILLEFMEELSKENLSTEKLDNKKTFGQKVKDYWKYFNTYEKLWFFAIIVISVVLAIVLPEEDTNGISGVVITIMYLLDVIIACFCELLTSKQSRWSFMIYNIVEVIEIATLIMIRARFASMAVAIFFWIPAHTISFFTWSKHKDQKRQELTVVRSMKWWQSILMYLGVAVWTGVVGYLMAAFGPETDFFSSDATLKAVAYMDACLSALSIADGVTIYFRIKQTWIIWYIYLAIETVVNIMTGQWILLVLKFGYLTNTTYGYIKWTQYISKNQIPPVGSPQTEPNHLPKV